MNQFRIGEQHCASAVTIELLCRAGSTAQAFPDIDNTPKDPKSVEALEALIKNVLEPIRLHYGSITITHGFTSQELIRKVPRGVAKQLDQHCSHEINPHGKKICKRDGASADIYVHGITAQTLAVFIYHHLPFDRMYLYGSEAPLHVSHAPNNPASQIIIMKSQESGKKIPQVIRSHDIQNALKGMDQ